MPDIATNVRNLVASMIRNVNILDIGIVDSLNETNNTLNITLLRLFQSRYSPYVGDNTVPTVRLYDIPVMRPNCRNFSLIPEYSIGDRVLVAYAKKDPHTQLNTDIPLNMDVYTDYTVENAIVLGTIPKWENLPPTATIEDDTTTTLMHKSESAIRFNTDGTLTIAEQFPNDFIDAFNIRSLDLTKITDKTYPKITMSPDGEISFSIVNDKGQYSIVPATGFPKLDSNEQKLLAEFKMKADKDNNFSFSILGYDSSDKAYGITMNNGNMKILAKTVKFEKVT